MRDVVFFLEVVFLATVVFLRATVFLAAAAGRFLGGAAGGGDDSGAGRGSGARARLKVATSNIANTLTSADVTATRINCEVVTVKPYNSRLRCRLSMKGQRWGSRMR